MRGWTYNVSYLDTVKGGSGQVLVLPADNLHEWLIQRPGVMIRDLSPNWLSVEEYNAWRKMKPETIRTS